MMKWIVGIFCLSVLGFDIFWYFDNPMPEEETAQEEQKTESSFRKDLPDYMVDPLEEENLDQITAPPPIDPIKDVIIYTNVGISSNMQDELPNQKKDQTVVLREGTKIDQWNGTIKRNGLRYEFQTKSHPTTLVILENSHLQRAEALLERMEESSDQLRWNISGEVTEYRGTNYLLLSSIVMDRN